MLNRIVNFAGTDYRSPPALRVMAFLLAVLIPAIILGASVLQPWTDPKWLFFDPLTAAEFSDDCCHVYYGFVSNLGVFLWIATAAIALFGALHLFLLKGPRDAALFALMAGLFSAWLGLDDAFLVHEIVLPKLGVSQPIVILAYLVIALLYVLSSWRIILKSDFWLLGLAGLGVGSSLIIDQVLHSIEGNIVVIEDSAKFFGIVCWFLFHSLAVLMILQRSAPQARTAR